MSIRIRIPFSSSWSASLQENTEISVWSETTTSRSISSAGANIRNILDFEKEYPDAKVIKLEQNYRSTGNILNAANGVISNNKGRKDKTLWTANGEGEKISLRQFDTAYDEAEFIAEDIKKEVRDGASYNDNAVLYRTNAQSRLLEEKFIAMNIPYKIVGGINFYARREIKDFWRI